VRFKYKNAARQFGDLGRHLAINEVNQMTTTAKNIISALTLHQPRRIPPMTGAELRRVLSDLNEYKKAHKE
tara:strand:- start:285 stop:497 length:213 start_codon:yes stop_codon:yes gene_type:complete